MKLQWEKASVSYHLNMVQFKILKYQEVQNFAKGNTEKS